jgi:cytoskeletal protein CcmA (bactofilin family)
MSIFKRDRGPYLSSSLKTANQPPPPVTSDPVKKISSPETTTPAAKVPVVESQATGLPVNREAAAVIDKKSEIKGTLHSQGNVLIEGIFQGEIEAKETVWVEKGAQTKAQLHANDVIVSGSFDGEIACLHRLQIAATASISGEIKTPMLVVEEGATVNCRFKMTRSGGTKK